MEIIEIREIGKSIPFEKESQTDLYLTHFTQRSNESLWFSDVFRDEEMEHRAKIG